MSASSRAGSEQSRPYDFVLLDTGPLGLLTHPRRGYREEASRWLVDLRREGVRVVVPEIADYELRRGLIRAGRGTERLDALEDQLVYLPITTPGYAPGGATLGGRAQRRKTHRPRPGSRR